MPGSRIACSLLLAVASTALAAPATAQGARGPAPAAHVSLTGTVQTVDQVGGSGGHQQLTELRAAGRSWSLRLPPDIPAVASGTVARVEGTARGSVVTASALRPVHAAPAVSTTGNQSVYVIRAGWSGNPADSTTAADIDTAFAAVSQWFASVSYGQLSGLTVIQDQTYETIAAPPTACATAAIFSAAVGAAHIDPADYDHVVVYFPQAQSQCTFGGQANINGGMVWLNGDLTVRVITHELGHNLGLFHAHALTCHDPHDASVPRTISTACDQPAEYGDPADTMGSAGVNTAGDYSAAQKARLGWLSSHLAAVAPCTSDVTLQPLEDPPVAADITAARVDGGADSSAYQPLSYWLEYRHPTAAGDPDLPLAAGLRDGVLVHLTLPRPDDLGPSLLDARPSTAAFTDAALPAGSSFSTPQGYKIQVLSTGGTAHVRLSTSKPSPPRTLSAARVSGAVKVSWHPPACLGSGANAVDHYQVTRVGSPAKRSTSLSLTFSGGVPQTGDTYLVSATNSRGRTGAAAVVPASAPAITNVDNHTYGNAAVLTFAASASNGGHQMLGYVARGVALNGASPRRPDSFYDVSSQTDRQVPWLLDPGQKYRVRILPVFDDYTFGPASAPVTISK